MSLSQDSSTESIEERHVFSLLQLNRSISKALDSKTGSSAFWVRAEIAKITETQSGFVYLDLVEESNGKRLAAIRGVLWRNNYEKIKKELGDSSGSVLNSGSEIVFLCRVKFHTVYGLKLEIEKIDLMFMMGELERRKAETLASIKKDRIHLKNPSLTLPTVIHRIALVGSPGTSGFRDFAHHLLFNQLLYRFDIEVYSTSVQGAEAPRLISNALLKAAKDQPDVIVLLRGGGSPLDLDCFNDLNLAKIIGDIKTPILTGIGHETDFCIADIVAHRSFKTPTDVGDFIVNRNSDFASLLVDIATRIGSRSKSILSRENTFLQNSQIILKDLPRRLLNIHVTEFNKLSADIKREVTRIFHKQKDSLEGLASIMELLQPKRTLARGYSIVRHNDNAIRNSNDVEPGDIIHIELHKGIIMAQVQESLKTNK